MNVSSENLKKLKSDDLIAFLNSAESGKVFLLVEPALSKPKGVSAWDSKKHFRFVRAGFRTQNQKALDLRTVRIAKKKLEGIVKREVRWLRTGKVFLVCAGVEELEQIIDVAEVVAVHPNRRSTIVG